MKLAKREKLFIGSAAGILGIFLILQLIVIPFFTKKNQLAKETDTLESYIKDMDRLGAYGQGIAEVSGSLDKILANRRESLLSFISKEAAAAGLEQENLPRINPSEGKEWGEYIEDICSVDLKAITLPQLTEFLYRVEKPEKFISINSITIRDNKKEEGYLDATIRVMSYKK